MKSLFLLFLFIGLLSSLFAQKKCLITSDEARQIAEKFVSCSGYTTERLPENVCKGYEITCNEKTIPCEFLEKKAYGYFPPQQNKDDIWTIVFRTKGELKSDITGVKVSMNITGKNIRLEESKVFLKFVDKRY